MYNLQRSPSRLVLMLALIAILAGLMPTNTIHARAVDEPLVDNTDPWSSVLPAATDDVQALQSVVEADAHGIDSDDFNACTLDTSVWTFRDPTLSGASFAVNGKQLSITVPKSKDYNLFEGANNAARVTQSVSDADFQVVAKFESELLGVPEVGGAFRMEGIIVEGVTVENAITHNEFLRFDIYSKYRASTDEHELWAYGAWVRDSASAAHLKEKIYTVATADFPSINNPEAVHVRVTRQARGDGSIRWIMEYKLDDGSWQPVAANIPPLPGEPAGSFVRNLMLDDLGSPGAIGVYAGSTATDPTDTDNGAPGHTAVVDYFFESDSEIIPEDADDYDLTTNAIGNGSIDVDPDQTAYACGDSITFEAMPDSGWAFTDWSGDLSGSTTSKTAAFVMGMDVTATFTQTAPTMYPLNVTIQGNGQVDKSPDATEYEEGTDVMLTATADAGHRFVGWSDDEVSTNNPVTVTMNSAKSIIAKFEEVPVDTYTLDIQVFPTDGSGGDATKSPDQTSYEEGTQVTLTATPNPGYTFTGWTGLINSTDEVVNVPMPAQNSVVLASFVLAEYTVSTQSNGNGSVSISPQKTSYRHGDQVTISATPGSGWSFVSWGGDVGGSENPQTITVTDDTDIVATFSSGQKMTYLPLVNR